MGKLKTIPDNADALQLAPKALAITTAVVLAAVLWLVPWYVDRQQNPLIGPDFRLSHDLRDDYWGYRHIARKVCEKYHSVFIGDSVVWGMYVDNTHTIPALLNRRLGREEFGNLAIDGLHPVAMERLIREYGEGISDKQVYLYWNPLWMNTPLYDLRGEKEFSINHPRLLPQFDRSIGSYRAPLDDRIGAFLDRKIDYRAYLHHCRTAFLDNEDFKTSIARHPGQNPFRRCAFSFDPGEKKKKLNSDVTWKRAGIAKQDWPFVPMATSRQFASFRSVIRELQKRGNRVCVVLGTLNPHMQTPESLARYRKLRTEVAATLDRDGIALIKLPELSSEEYADASHPLARGYLTLADFILKRISEN